MMSPPGERILVANFRDGAFNAGTVLGHASGPLQDSRCDNPILMIPAAKEDQ
jgi:hypothetical protein